MRRFLEMVEGDPEFLRVDRVHQPNTQREGES